MRKMLAKALAVALTAVRPGVFVLGLSEHPPSARILKRVHIGGGDIAVNDDFGGMTVLPMTDDRWPELDRDLRMTELRRLDNAREAAGLEQVFHPEIKRGSAHLYVAGPLRAKELA